MRRDNQIGSHQRRALLLLACFRPRPVDARILAHVANPAGDQTQGNRVLAALEARDLIKRDSISRSVDRTVALKWRITDAGLMALIESLPGWVEGLMDEGVK